MTVIPVVYATNDVYAPYTAAAISSLCAQADPLKKYCVYVLSEGLSIESRNLFAPTPENISLEIIDVCVSDYVEPQVFYERSYLTSEMYFRLLIPTLLPQYEKVIYLDSDTILLGDPAELYAIDIGNNALGAVYDFPNSRRAAEIRKIGLESEGYFNSGVLLINISEFKKQDIFRKCCDILKNDRKLICPDQDALNISCKGNVFMLPDIWNFQWGHSIDGELRGLSDADKARYIVQRDNLKLIHYTSAQKPWNSFDFTGLSAHFWHYAEKLECYNRLVERFVILDRSTILNTNLNDIVAEQFRSGKIGLRTVFRFIKCWFDNKLKHNH